MYFVRAVGKKEREIGQMQVCGSVVQTLYHSPRDIVIFMKHIHDLHDLLKHTPFAPLHTSPHQTNTHPSPHATFVCLCLIHLPIVLFLVLLSSFDYDLVQSTQKKLQVRCHWSGNLFTRSEWCGNETSPHGKGGVETFPHGRYFFSQVLTLDWISNNVLY